MLPKRALHSANGWLMCRVFCKSMIIRFSPVFLSNSDASLLLEATQAIRTPIVFIFFTILYHLNTRHSLVELSITRRHPGSSIRFSPSSAGYGQSASHATIVGRFCEQPSRTAFAAADALQHTALILCIIDRKIFAPSALPSRASEARSG